MIILVFIIFLITTKVYIDALLNYVMSKKIEISEDQLRNFYEKDKLTTYQIARQIGCCQTTVWKRLIKFRIKRRSPYELNSNVPSKKELIKLYQKRRLSTWAIEKKYGYSRGTIHRKLGEFGIKTRDRAESHVIFPRKDFSGDLIEKAYLIGFRIGDLGVRKICPNSRTVCVASGSTIKEQIELIKKLFEGYGKVWIQTTKTNKINIQTNLNDSFGFLLSKDFPDWIKKDKKIFFSFLAGFSDAEGSLIFGNKSVYYSLGNYDSPLLFEIYKNLNRFGIACKQPKSDNRKGKANSQGYRYASNYWSLRVYNKMELLKLLLNMKPYIKHKLKIKALNMAIENINQRNQK